MKKVMVVAAVALAAVCTNAATLKWGVNNIGIPTEGGAQSTDTLITSSTPNVGMYVYILDGAISGSVWDNYATLAGDHYTLNTDGAKQQGDASWKNSAATFTDPNDHTKGTDTATGYAAAVLVYDTNADGIINDGDWYLALQDEYTFTGGTGRTIPLMDEDSGNWTKITISGPGPDPTPEPTTGMLMLIGLAGLALRRRRA